MTAKSIGHLQLYRGTHEQWSIANPVLSDGEIGFCVDRNTFCIGDGTTAYNSLPIFGRESIEDAPKDNRLYGRSNRAWVSLYDSEMIQIPDTTRPWKRKNGEFIFEPLPDHVVDTALNTWTTHSINGQSSWVSLTWANSIKKFVALHRSYIATSQDAKSWQVNPVDTDLAPISPIQSLWVDEWDCLVWPRQRSIGYSHDLKTVHKVELTYESTNNVPYSFGWSKELGVLAIGTSALSPAQANQIAHVLTMRGLSTPTIHQVPYDGEIHVYTIWAASIGKFCVMTMNSNGGAPLGVKLSGDGNTWTQHLGPASGFIARCIDWSPKLGKFLVTGLSTDKALVSTNGQDWSTITLPVKANWQECIWADDIDRFLLYGNSTQGTKLLSTKDLVTWKTHNFPGYGHRFVWSKGAGRVVCLDFSGNARVCGSLG